MPQEIGVKAVWSNKAFTPGLNAYLASLVRATTATQTTATAITGLGATLNNAFNIARVNGQLTIATLNALTKAAKAATAAVAAANQRQLRQPRAQRGATGAGANVVGPRTIAQINAGTTATRAFGRQAQQTTINVNTLSTATIALGTTIGQLAATGIANFARSLVTFGGNVLEIVTFFERLDLSIAFYASRSIQAENATLSFTEALAAGSREAAGLSLWLQRLAVASPFTTRDVGTLFRTAQAYGLTRQEAELLTPLLLDFAAAAGLNEDILERLALAVGQIRARGKLTGEEVRQLGNSGIPIRDILVKALGIANDEFDDLLESGALTSDVVIPAIIESLRDFEGAGERVAFETIGGIVSAFDELREIGIARFFTAVLAPVKQSFQDLFAVLNRPEVIAFVQVLGEEIGVKLRNALFGLVETVRNLIASWQALDPLMQQQIIVFAAATAGVFALTAVFGLLTIAVNLLLSPLSLIAITVGFLVSEWTSGFAVLGGVTTRAANTVGRAMLAIGTYLGNALAGFLNFLSEANLGFRYFVRDLTRFGREAMGNFVDGMISGVGLVARAMGSLGNYLAFWLAPGSPPRVAPEIDKWGEATMEEYIAAFGNANVRKSLGNGLSIVSDTISQELIDARRQAVDRLNQAHPDLGLTLAQDLQRVVAEAYAETEDALASTDAVESEAAAAGIRVSDAFVDSFLSRIPALTPRISKELQEVLRKIGGGTQLTREGASSFGRFLQGFGEADFGVLEETSGIVQDFLQSLVDTGQIEEVDLPRLLFGAREGLAQGIQDIQRVGAVTQQTMQTIRATAGGASRFVLDLLESYAPLAQATKNVELAQNTLNAVTERYKAILTPLREELERINEANRLADEEEKILSLRRLIANDAVSNRRRQNAQLQIDQILAERRVRGLEAERDAATETAEAELESREKTREEAEKQFATLQQNIQAQLNQIGLFSQEASIIRKLQEEAAKLREKEMTDADLRLKFLELQNEELADLIEAARAKYDLDRADSTELEKQQAAITLAEIALRRRNREAEAISLGIPVEELTKLRDFEVTLDDIGVKGKEAFNFEGADANLDSLVNADEITRQWEDTLERVRAKWDEIKQAVIDTATEIDNRLPSFLRIFPEEPGAEPPIIGFLKTYTEAIIGLGVAIGTYKIISRALALGIAIRNLATLGTLGGAAAGGAAAGGAAAGGATGAAAVIAGITTAILSLGSAALLATGYLIALKAASDAFAGSQEEQAARNTEEIATAVGDFGPALQAETDRLISQVGIVSDDAKSALANNITTAAVSAIGDGFGDEHVVASIGNAITRSIAEGLIADTPENRSAIAAFQANLATILTTTSTGEIPKINFFTRAELVAEPTPEQETEVKKQYQGFLAGITDDEETKGTFATSVESLVKDATSLGFERAKIDTLVFGAFSEGVKAGLVSDTPENRSAIAAYIDGIIAELQTQAEIESPSGLTEREIGVPMGEGILRGIGNALSTGSAGLVSISNIMFGELKKSFDNGRTELIGVANATRTGINNSYLLLKTLLATRMTEINLAQKTAWTLLRTDAETEIDALVLSVDTDFAAIHTNLDLKMPEIKNVVVGAFIDMRTESEAELGALRTSVVNLLAGKEDSLLTDLQQTFLGLDQVIPKNIGKLFIEGIADGITENQQTLADALRGALVAALVAAQEELQIKSPSVRAATEVGLPFVAGIARGIMDNFGMVADATRFALASAVQAPLQARVGGSAGGPNAATATNYSRTTHYHLNVKSAMQSQGIVADFGIMKTMRPRN